MIQETKEDVFVFTPHGKKYHGFLQGDSFIRYVSSKKDLMFIFDAWSIHPEALAKLKTMTAIKKLKYIQKEGNFTYEITKEKAIEKGFEKEFAGGKTIYIPRKYWTISPSNQMKLL